MGIDAYRINSNLMKFLTVLMVSGCSVLIEPPVVENSTTQKVFDDEQRSSKLRFGKFRSKKHYLVQKGDTLYSIAWKYGMNYQDLAGQNDIGPSFVIYPGQKLLVSRAKKRMTVVRRESPTRASKAISTKKKSAPQATRALEKVVWVWPLKGKPTAEYSSKNKGIDYQIKKATRLVAAGKGSVVYEGGGIGGFENLIIIKHSNQLLSAYSFNGGTAIKEQQQVNSGDLLARIKPDSQKSESVHFEVRRNGRPIDPSELIKASS